MLIIPLLKVNPVAFALASTEMQERCSQNFGGERALCLVVLYLGSVFLCLDMVFLLLPCCKSLCR